MLSMRRAGLCWAVVVLLAAPVALSQSRNIEVAFGFEGEVVAEAWNPLRVTLRDQPSLELMIDIEYGTLRDGTQLFQYRAALPGGGGLHIFEDDIFLPAWRSFRWQVRSEEAVLASGSLDRRQADPRPLSILIAARPGAYRALLPAEARLVEARAPLPERLAAYHGVEALLVADAFEPPRSEALLAASAAGSHVLLLAQGELSALLASGPQRLGAGWLGTPEQRLSRLDTQALATALATPALSRPPDNQRPLNLVIVAAGYLLAVLLLVRFGGVPGLLSGFGLTLLVTAIAWVALRPAEEALIRSRSLTISAGGLAQRLEVMGVFSYPGRTLTLGSARPLGAASWELTPQGLTMALPRWSSVVLLARPRLSASGLEWHQGELYNRSGEALGDVFIVGLGAQEALPANSRRPPQQLSDSVVPPLYQPLLPLLPDGAALGRSGGRLYLALPEGGS